MQKDWFETWFHSPYYEALYYRRDKAEAKSFIDALITYLQPAPHSKFLDLACGSGRHSVYLSSLGYDVTGLDISDELIEQAVCHANDHLEFFVHDMRNDFRTNFFDYTLNLFTSFGYFKTEHDNQRVVKNIFNGLKPGGRFVLDFFNADKTIAKLVREETKKINNAVFNISRHVENGFIIKKIRISDAGNTSEFFERVRAFSRKELKLLFTQTGFIIEKEFGSYALEEFSNASDRLIIVAKKP